MRASITLQEEQAELRAQVLSQLAHLDEGVSPLDDGDAGGGLGD